MRRRALLLAACASLASGCGYSLQGRGITTDPSIKTIGVPLFKDRTGKLGLATRVTGAVVSELVKRGRFKIEREAAGVDAVVDGEIISYTVVPVNFSGSQLGAQHSRYAIAVTANVVYRKLGQKEPLWSNESFSVRDEYDLGSRPEVFVDREDESIERLVDSFARNLVSAMLEAF